MKTKIISIILITVLLLSAGFYFAILNQSNESPLEKTEYGVCIHIYQYDTTTTLQLLKQINATWVRIDWMNREKMEEFIVTMKENNVSILAILDHNTMYQGFTRQQWQERIQEIMSTEAAKKVDAWEIWNEPNANQFFLGYMNGNPQNYYEMLQDAYQIIKTASPNASVLAAGLSPSKEISYRWKDWLTDFENLSPQEYFDYQGVHIYDDIETNLNIISETKEIINKDIWITEIGRPSEPSFNNYSQQDQAFYLELNYNKLKELRIPIFWYQLIDETNAFPPKENHFGLFDSLNNPKLAVEVFIKFAS